MAKQTKTMHMLPAIQLDFDSQQPLYRQVYEGLRSAILTQQLLPGTRLPSTRDLAQALSVSRNTIKNAFEQLLAEGYLDAVVGSGTYVSQALPTDFMEVHFHEDHLISRTILREHMLSLRSRQWKQLRVDVRSISNRDYAFRNGMPALDRFPFDLWAGLAAKHYRNLPLPLFDDVENRAGYWPLREAIADYLNTARGARCTSDQIVITTGTQQALYAAAQILLDVGDTVWIEDPGYLGARSAFAAAGANIVPIPVDAQGMMVENAVSFAPRARLVFTTPSHQFPFGSTLSLARRLQLLEWASQNDAWIIEDDYNSEYRYVGRPLSCLQGLDSEQRVLYMGSFNKVLFSGLRIGYVVAPFDLVNVFQDVCILMNGNMPIVPQAVLAEFLQEGHFYQHVRKMRTLYAQRRSVFLDAVQHYCGDLLSVGAVDAGMHVVGWLPESVTEAGVAAAARSEGLEVLEMSDFFINNPHRPGLLLGYTAIQDERIASNVQLLANIIQRAIF